jgi:hypothetical protein
LNDLFSVKYAKQLDYLFTHYAKQEDIEFNKDPDQSASTIQYKTFATILKHFNISPKLIDPEDVVLIFNFLLRDKSPLGKDGSRVIDYDNFLEALVRITILAKKKLMDPDNITESNKERIKSFDLSGVNAELVEKLLNYMNLTPGEKLGSLVRLLKSIKTGKRDSVNPADVKSVKTHKSEKEQQPKHANKEESKDKEADIPVDENQKEDEEEPKVEEPKAEGKKPDESKKEEKNQK